jgi:hypothetical protein
MGLGSLALIVDLNPLAQFFVPLFALIESHIVDEHRLIQRISNRLLPLNGLVLVLHITLVVVLLRT